MGVNVATAADIQSVKSQKLKLCKYCSRWYFLL